MTRNKILEVCNQFYTGGNVSEREVAFARYIMEYEREACAEVCKKHADVYAGLEQNPTTQSAWAACIDNRDAIRERGQA
jgi:hypothetical protein